MKNGGVPQPREGGAKAFFIALSAQDVDTLF